MRSLQYGGGGVHGVSRQHVPSSVVFGGQTPPSGFVRHCGGPPLPQQGKMQYCVAPQVVAPQRNGPAPPPPVAPSSRIPALPPDPAPAAAPPVAPIPPVALRPPAPADAAELPAAPPLAPLPPVPSLPPLWLPPGAVLPPVAVPPAPEDPDDPPAFDDSSRSEPHAATYALPIATRRPPRSRVRIRLVPCEHRASVHLAESRRKHRCEAPRVSDCASIRLTSRGSGRASTARAR
jgi:hypothetical protein